MTGWDFYNIKLDEWRLRAFDSPAEHHAALASPRYETDEQFRQAVTERMALMPEHLQPQARVVSEAEVVQVQDAMSGKVTVNTDGSDYAEAEAALVALYGPQAGAPAGDDTYGIGAVRITRTIDGRNIDAEPPRPSVQSVAAKLAEFAGLPVVEQRAALEALPAAEQAVAFQIVAARSED